MPQNNLNTKDLQSRIKELEEKIKILEKNKPKKFGLVWEEKTEEVVEKCKENIPILKLKENFKGVEPVLILDKEKPENILIEGDNYEALNVLNYTHKGKIDIIYIDPPYNTGNKDFIYNDDYINRDDEWRHSMWLSFMQKRLILAKSLLSSSGVIFISIDDNEMAHLKLLCDSLFEERNFLTCISRVAKTASNKGRHFAPSVDYVLVYARNIDVLELFKGEVDAELYKKKDEKGYYRDDVALYQSGLIGHRPNCRYFILCPDGSKVIPPEKKFWRWSPNTTEENKSLLVFKETKSSPLLNEYGKQAKWNIYTKSYLIEREEDGTVPRNYLDQFINRQGADFLKTMGIVFDYSKPIEMIKYLIKITNKGKDSLSLDFMAGSGTTGHAVLELNKEDGGNRKFILCTNNENKICEEVTYERIKRVMKGYNNKKGEKVEGLGGNLKYFKTSFVDKDKIEGVDDETKLKLTYEVGEMIGLKEYTLNEIEKNDYWQIFRNLNEDKLTAIYFKEDKEKLGDLVKKLEGYINESKLNLSKKNSEKISGVKIALYVFSWTKNKYRNEYGSEDIRVEDIPEPILEVYKDINKI